MPKQRARTLKIPVKVTDAVRAAFEQYCGRVVSDEEIGERLTDVLASYLHDAVGVK